MLNDPSLLDHAGQMLEEELARELTSGVAPPAERRCMVMWVLPQCLSLMHQSCDQPARQFAPLIKRMILEHTFHDLCGDHQSSATPADFGTMAVEYQVRAMVRVLERVRSEALADGQWSNTPVTPMMFG